MVSVLLVFDAYDRADGDGNYAYSPTMAALTLRIPPLETRREASESALTLRIPPLEARREVETVKTTPVAYDPPMAALTLRIPPREARREIEGPEKPLVLRLPAPSQSQSQSRPQQQSSAASTSKGQEGESSAGKLCYKCNKPLPNVKWPWKRCLECRLSAERLAQESTAAHATGRKVRKVRRSHSTLIIFSLSHSLARVFVDSLLT